MNVIALHQTIKKAAGWKFPNVLVANRHKTNQCSFYCSMLRPNNACRKHLILSFYQRKKKSSIRRQWLPAKDLPQL